MGEPLIGGEEVQVTLPMGEGLAYSPEQLLANLDWGGVEKAVLLQGPMYGECNRYALDALQQLPGQVGWRRLFRSLDGRQPYRPLNRRFRRRAFARSSWSALSPSGLCGIHPEAQLGAPESRLAVAGA